MPWLNSQVRAPAGSPNRSLDASNGCDSTGRVRAFFVEGTVAGDDCVVGPFCPQAEKDNKPVIKTVKAYREPCVPVDACMNEIPRKCRPNFSEKFAVEQSSNSVARFNCRAKFAHPRPGSYRQGP